MIFIFACGVTLSFFHIIEMLRVCDAYKLALINGEILGNPMLPVLSVFVSWLGVDGASFETNLFYLLFPIVAAFPYGWSLAGELHSGYIENILCRTDRKAYFLSKYVAVFVSGAIAVFVPLMLDFFVLFMNLPALKPEGIYPYGPIGQKSMWSGIYCEHPLIYTLMYIMLDCLFAGFLATVSMTLAFYIKQKLAVVLMPFFLLLFVDYLNIMLPVENEFSPMKFLHVLPTCFDRLSWVIVLEGVILFVFTLGVVLWKERRYEVL